MNDSHGHDKKCSAVLVRSETLDRFYQALAIRCGAPRDEAETFAWCLLRADLRGRHTQGAALVPYLVSLLESGLARFRAPWTVINDTGAVVLVDGGRGIGSVVGWRAMELAVQRARALGTGCVWVRNGGDYAMAANHTLQAAELGVIGLTVRNGNPRVAPWGGADALFGTDPISLAIPARGGAPIVIDMAAGSYSVGQVVMAARDGNHMPDAFLVDPEGNRTDDPSRVVHNPEERESPFLGALLTQGHKGFAWILLAELFTGLIAGTGPSAQNTHSPTPDNPWQEATFFMAVDPARVAPDAVFADGVDSLVTSMERSRALPGFDGVRIPGRESAQREAQYRREGIPLREEVLRDLVELGTSQGVDVKDLAGA